MKNRTKTEAELYRRRLAKSSEVLSEIVVWADSIIASDEVFDPLISEIAMSGDKNIHYVDALLSRLPGECTPAEVSALQLAHLKRQLDANPLVAKSIAWQIYLMAVDGCFESQELEFAAYTLDDGFELADQGVTTAEEALDDLKSFLNAYAVHLEA